MGSSGWKFLLFLGWTTEETKKAVTGTQRECGQMWAGDRQRACVRARATDRAVSDRFRMGETKTEPQESGITVRKRKDSESEPHNADPDRESVRDRDRDPWRETNRRLRTREVRRRLPWGSGEEGHGDRGGLGTPGLLPPAWTPGAHSEGLCGRHAVAGRTRPALRGPGAPWPRRARPGCGRAAPSRPAAQRGPGRRRSRCRSPES